MAYLPALCERCHRAQLVAAQDVQSQAICCRRCGATLRVIPGCIYVDRDRELFEELSEIVAEAGVSAREAAQWAASAAEALWSRRFTNTFDALATRLPGITPLQMSIGSNVDAQRRVFQTLKTIFDGLVATLGSGSMSRVAAGPEPQQTRPRLPP